MNTTDGFFVALPITKFIERHDDRIYYLRKRETFELYYQNCLLDLEPFGSHLSPLYGEKSWNVFIKNLIFFSTEERMT